MTVQIPLKIKQSSRKLQQLEKKLLHYTKKAIFEYKLIQPKDRVLVCVSGGKDSISLLMLLNKIRIKNKNNFEIFAFTLDQSQPGWDDSKLIEFYQKHNINYEILTKDTYSVVVDKIPADKTYCGLCSRLRRGNIYNYAKTHGFTKIALGHHRDDLINSLLMAILYNGEVRSMPPKLLTEDKRHLVIRPMIYCQEQDIAEYARIQSFPIIPCNLCGSQQNLARNKIKLLIKQLSGQNPKIPSNILHALQKVCPSQLMDKNLWDFDKLDADLIKGELKETL